MKETANGICSRANGRQHELGGLWQGHRAQAAHHLHPRPSDRLPAGHLYPGSGHRRRRAARIHGSGRGRSGRYPEHVHRRRDQPHGHLCPRHHALYLGLDHRAADDRHGAQAGTAQERGRAGPQEDQPVHPLRHRVSGDLPGLWSGGVPAGGRSGDRSRLVFHRLLRDHAGRRHDVPDVARANRSPRAASATASR